jgi:glutathione S-transferase
MTTESELTLYYWPGACSLAAHIVLEESGLPFRAVKVNFAEAEQKTPAYLSINPKGRVPALATPSGVLTENPAILYYLARQMPEKKQEVMDWPMDPTDAARCIEWLAWCASTLHVAFAHISRSERYADSVEGKTEVAKKGAESCRPLWESVERRLALAASPWALGERYSVVDPYLQVFWNWGRGDRLKYDMTRDFPSWTRHAQRLAERPAVQRAFVREGLMLPV